jgi:deoxyribonuclease-4
MVKVAEERALASFGCGWFRMSFNRLQGGCGLVLQLGAHVSAAGGVDLALGRAAEFEMASCQLFTKNERQWVAKPLDPAVIERYFAKREEIGIRHVISHDSYLINIASPDDMMWEKSRQALLEELRRCDQLEIPYLVSHPGAHVGSGSEAAIERVAEAVNRIHDEMPASRAVLLLETTAGQGTCLGATFEDLAEMIDRIHDKARVGVCFDTCHVFAAGYELRDAEGYEATMSALDAIVGLARIKCLHLNDSLKGIGSRVDRHAHIGEGELGKAAFDLILNDARFDGLPGVLETPKGPDAKEDRMNLDTLMSLVRQPIGSPSG